MTRLTGKVAIVTGGANGIGLRLRAPARERRRRVAIGDIDAAAGEAAAEALRGEGLKVIFVADRRHQARGDRRAGDEGHRRIRPARHHAQQRRRRPDARPCSK